MSGRLETVRLEVPSRRIRRKEEVEGRRIRGDLEVRREGQGRLEICAEVGPNNRLGDTMAPNSYRSVKDWVVYSEFSCIFYNMA